MKSGMHLNFYTFSENIVKLLLIMAEVFLFCLSIMRTSVISGYEEHTDYLVENPLFHIILIMFILASILFISFLKIKYHKFAYYIKLVLRYSFWMIFTFHIILAIYWIFHTQFQALGDSSILWQIACKMLNGNYSDFTDLGYAERHFNQMGSLFFLKSLVLLVGPDQQFVLQIINVAALSILILCIRGLTIRLFSHTLADAAAILLILYFPISLYVVFTYSNLLSWSLLSVALYHEVLFIQTQKKRYGVSMVLFLTCSVLLKSFSWIAFIAMIIYALYDVFRQKKYCLLYYLAAAVILILLAGRLMGHSVSVQTGEVKRRTMPALGYLAMGMQESYMAPGWYNGIHDITYQACEGDKELMNKAFSSMVNERIHDFVNNPAYFARFYYFKTASQWNNPSFQGFWFGEISTPDVTVPQWIHSIYQGPLRQKLDVYLNYLLTIIHFGIVLWLIIDYRKIRMQQLLCGIYFLGGFIFLMLWEAKCQYTLGFFLFLFPYSCAGYKAVCNAFYNKLQTLL